MADQYRANAKRGEVSFSTLQQQLIILGLLDASRYVACEIHAVATEPSHFHVLASWRGERSGMLVSNSLRGRVKRELNTTEHRRWLARDASRRQVKSRTHFEHLMETYLPKHGGLKWNQQQGIYE
ncbi:hypothetical protein [Posidoniimonas corsicana]|uniref:hypothetical protein n=1 Tax=Posidoniimonas corsicana TaxID=1938618 RepID=UPI0011B7D832|nr:hypothetical protein [Posidoniimonas corsicana]